MLGVERMGIGQGKEEMVRKGKRGSMGVMEEEWNR